MISQRKNEAEIRLRDGAVSLLGGLNADRPKHARMIDGIPGLVNMPVLGKYFVRDDPPKTISRSELVIALIPHIVRTQDVGEEDLRGIAAGTDQTVKLSRGPKPEGIYGGSACRGGCDSSGDARSAYYHYAGRSGRADPVVVRASGGASAIVGAGCGGVAGGQCDGSGGGADTGAMGSEDSAIESGGAGRADGAAGRKSDEPGHPQ